MQEVLVDICEHASGGLERVVGGFESGLLEAVLVRCMAGEHSGNVEDDRSFLERERVLRGGFVCESVKPADQKMLAQNQRSRNSVAYHVNETLMWFSSTGNLKSNSSSWP